MIDQTLLDYAVEDLAEMIIDKLLGNEKFQDFFFDLDEYEEENFLWDLEDSIEEWMSLEDDVEEIK